MKIGVFDNRGPAEAGQRLVLTDPSVRDGEPLGQGKKTCAVIVRGATSRSVQAEVRARQKARITARKGEEVDEIRVMEDAHTDLCENAAPLIVGFENMEHDDGHTLTATPEDIQWFLDLTFPVMGFKSNESGDPILSADGQPQFEMKNNPFARQITDFSAEQSLTLGNGKKA